MTRRRYLVYKYLYIHTYWYMYIEYAQYIYIVHNIKYNYINAKKPLLCKALTTACYQSSRF